MTVLIHPADETGCGKHRLIWPAQVLAERGYDVTVESPENRRLHMHIDTSTGLLDQVEVPEGTDVLVLQRPAHFLLAQAIPLLRAKGVSVVVDVDDDLHAIHPENVAFRYLHPDRHRLELADVGYSNRPGMPSLTQAARRLEQVRPYPHNWNHLDTCCREASLVTVSTPRLLRRYAPHGRGQVIHNYLADIYYGHERQDSANLGWPASIWSHPNDPAAVGSSVARILREQGGKLMVWGDEVLEGPGIPRPVHVAERFGLRPNQVVGGGVIPLEDWPKTIAQIGVGLCPLAPSTFNDSKSWLKGEEMSAVGVPWVGSPTTEYRRLNSMGAGMLAKSAGDWYRALRELTKSETRRAELVAAGREVASQLRLRDNAWRWEEAWAAARANDKHAVS